MNHPQETIAVRLVWRQRDLDGLIRTRSAWYVRKGPWSCWFDATRYARQQVSKGKFLAAWCFYIQPEHAA